MTAEQFAAFDTQLYLDTHPNDRNACQIFNQYNKAYADCKREYEALYGPISSGNTEHGSWCWLNNPWPWEKEAN